MNKNEKFHNEHPMSKEDLKHHMSEELLEQDTSAEALEKMSKMTTEEIVNEHMELLKKDGKHSDVDEECEQKVTIHKIPYDEIRQPSLKL
jgi:hypothetical protein